MNNRYRLSMVLVALALACQSCGLLTSSNHDIEAYKPVFADASAGNLEAVKTAVEKNHSVLNAREWDDATLLHLAVQQNQKAMAEFLLNAGSDVEAKTQDGLTALHMAAQNGNIEIIQLLLDHKAKINDLDSKGWTPLDRATKWEHPAAADFLKARGAQTGSAH
jgi:ankyrin repeat protein